MLHRRTFLVSTVALLLLAMASSVATASDANTRSYQVTITNRTNGQWFTPAAVATHRGAADFFTVGDPASFEVKEIAENGNLGPMVDLFASNIHVWESIVVTSPSGPPPIGPGASISFDITSSEGARFLSWVSMLICTNDGFTGLDAVKLPVQVGATATHFTAAYDAGTEVNTEAWSDLVPPCAQLTGFGDQGGSGVSNPALAEGGVIHMHGGIAGTADLTALHDWVNPVAEVEITRTG